MAVLRLQLSFFALLLGSYTMPCMADVVSEGDVQLDFNVHIGLQNDGSLTLTAPSTIDSNGNVYLARQENVSGTFTIDGTTHNVQGEVVVGEHGNGALNILNGGIVNSPQFSGNQLEIGRNDTAVGTVHVQGPGSRLEFFEGFASVGGNGLGTMLIEDAARAAFRDISIGGFSQGEGQVAYGSATVRGPESLLEAREGLRIGSLGTGELRVENGAKVRSNTDSRGGRLTIGHYPFGGQPQGQRGSGSVHVDGAGSLLSQNGMMIVGGVGSGNVTITNAAAVNSGIALLGGDEGLNQYADGSGVVTLEGIGSQWNVANLILGQTGTGEISLSGGARLINSNSEFFPFGSNGRNTVFGAESGSYGRMIVDGTTTQWVDNSDQLTIGARGTGELIIQGGAVVTSGSTLISPLPGGHGEVLVSGAGSRWRVGSISIGEQGGQGKVTVANGAVLESGGFQDSANVYEGGELALVDGTFLGIRGGRENPEIRNFGLVRGNGEIDASIRNEQAGRVRVDAGERLVVSGALSNSGGRVEILAGELEVNGGFENQVSATLTVEDSTLRLSTSPFSGLTPLRNEGTFLVSNGENRVFGDVRNLGIITLAGDSDTTFFDDVENSGAIHVLTGSTVTYVGALTGNGSTGGGMVIAEGNVSPGFSPGVMEFGGDIALGDFSQLNIEIGNQQNDMLAVAGTAELGGDLVLSALEALEGDTAVEILSAATIDGTFDSIPAIGEEIGLGVVFGGITYNADSVVVSLLQQTGDFNGDGNVDAIDLGTWQSGYGTLEGAELLGGDAQRDGDIDGADFLTWQRNVLAAEPPVASQAVPEPSSVWMIILATISLFAQRP